MSKFIFPIDVYKDCVGQSFVMHCATEEEANIFLSFLDSIGRRWSSGDSYLRKNYFSNYGSNTCYYFNRGVYGHVESAELSESVVVLRFSDFMTDEEEQEMDNHALDEFFSTFSIEG